MKIALLLGFAVLISACISNSPYVDIQTSTSQIRVFVEAADEPGEWERGLMFREELPVNRGMLFIFLDEAERSFWMKNTLIPLDMIFADSEGIIVSIQKNVLPCKAVICESYPSEKPAKYVLEVNGGFADKNGIKTGDVVRVEPDKQG